MKKAKIFQNGQSQAIRLPKEFRFQGQEVFLKKQGDLVILIPIKNQTWEHWIQGLDQFSDDFLNQRNQPHDHQTREDF